MFFKRTPVVRTFALRRYTLIIYPFFRYIIYKYKISYINNIDVIGRKTPKIPHGRHKSKNGKRGKTLNGPLIIPLITPRGKILFAEFSHIFYAFAHSSVTVVFRRVSAISAPCKLSFTIAFISSACFFNPVSLLSSIITTTPFL